MADDQKKGEKDFQSFCQNMPCADMIKKMMEAKKAGLPFDCTAMMSQMMKMFSGGQKTKEGSAPETKETDTPRQ